MIRFALALAALGPMAGSAAAACLDYGKPVTLTGHVEHRMAYGAPNFGQTPDRDTPEPYYALVLDRPICMNDGGANAPDDEPAERNVRDITVGYPSEKDTNTKFLRRVAGISIRVVVTGAISHGYTSHHHTKLLMGVTSARPASKDSVRR